SVSFWRLSFLPSACRRHRLERMALIAAWAAEAREWTRVPARSLQEPACRILLPPPLLLRSLPPATRCRHRCRRILLLHRVRKVWDRRTSLLLLDSLAAGCG